MGVTEERAPTPPRVSPARTAMLALVAIAAMPNGLYFSPWFDSVLFLLPRAASAFFIRSHEALFYLTGMLLWLMTLVLAGVPAALYEFARRRRQPTFSALLVWLIAALLLSIPSFRAALELLQEPS